MAGLGTLYLSLGHAGAAHATRAFAIVAAALTAAALLATLTAHAATHTGRSPIQ